VSDSELRPGSTFSDNLLEGNEDDLGGFVSGTSRLFKDLSRFPKYLGNSGMLVGTDGSALIVIYS
jgi:hypothetical protein